MMIGRLQRRHRHRSGHPYDQRFEWIRLKDDWRTGDLVWERCERCGTVLTDELSA